KASASLRLERTEAARQAPDDPDPLMQALNEALDLPGATEDGGGGRAAMGPPLSQGEKDGLRLQIESCWNIGSLSREAQRTAVSVQFSMSPDGMPEPDSLRMIGFDGGSEAAAGQAFEAARRAILRCALQGGGFSLPAEKYARWRDTIIDFRPQGGPSIR
ncbi:MAG: protein TolA, partial [Paracoccus sp. (in: a-proteobacteria)]|nr:protein TolA [Paracoccus sp. (in: a-proteobacteria)]